MDSDLIVLIYLKGPPPSLGCVVGVLLVAAAAVVGFVLYRKRKGE